ncbi:unnamed protein product [Mytilus edulis]|uniref:Uncharacterized protein n=1 Tax=Mytilus edulis TaxID=6550 RepID=A0A8S3U573_MYTED|nr:unnamed protein product [Mytilus edulis]
MPTTKHRIIKRLKNALTRTPKRRSATLATYLQHTKSPAVEILRQREVLYSPEDQMDMSIEKAVLQDIKTATNSCKPKRSKDSVISMNVLVESISGNKVTETSDLVDVTLCNKKDHVPNISCLKRDCGEYGINKLELLTEETDDLDTAQLVKWRNLKR